jgi:hypothetical protein
MTAGRPGTIPRMAIRLSLRLQAVLYADDMASAIVAVLARNPDLSREEIASAVATVYRGDPDAELAALERAGAIEAVISECPSGGYEWRYRVSPDQPTE